MRHDGQCDTGGRAGVWSALKQNAVLRAVLLPCVLFCQRCAKWAQVFRFNFLFRMNHLSRKKNVIFEITAASEILYIEPLWNALLDDPRIELFLSVHMCEIVRGLSWPKYRAFLSKKNVSRNRVFDASIIRFLKGIDLFLSPTTYTHAVPSGDMPKVQVLHSLYVKPKIILGGNFMAFNVLFLSGPNLREYFERHFLPAHPGAGAIKLVEVGYPKSDALVLRQYDATKIKSALSIEKGVPVVLYAPTYDASLVTMGTKIIDTLASMDVMVLVKLHPASVRHPANFLACGVDWKGEMERCRRDHPNVIPIYDFDSNPYLEISDVLVTDVSSVAYEFMLLDKPVVYIDTPEYFDKQGQDDIAHWGRDAGIVVTDMDGLRAAVARSLQNPSEFSPKRAEFMKKQIYNPGHGTGKAIALLSQFLFER